MATTQTTPQAATPEERLFIAALTYLLRSNRVFRHPRSFEIERRLLFNFGVTLTMPRGDNNAGHWKPYVEPGGERRPCCDRVRTSSRFPYRPFVHCCTALHVAELYGVDRRELLKLARDLLFLVENFM